MKLRQHDFFTRLLRTRPILLAALLYLCGCMLAYFMAPLPAVLYAGMALFVLFFLLLIKKNKRLAAAMLALAFIPFGALRFNQAWDKVQPLPDQKDALLSGRIAKIPSWNEETERMICVLEDLSIDGKAIHGYLRLYLRGEEELLKAAELGRQISCSAHIWEAETAANPGEFNFSNYLRTKGLRGYATAEIEETILSEPVYHFRDWPELICMRIGTRIDRLFPENSALARAFILGDRSELSEADRESYSLSGAAHLLAISGMHISMLAGAVCFLLGRFINRRKAFIASFLLVLLYGAMIGYSASMLRAIIMFGVFGAAPLLGRYSDSPTRLGVAMLLYLLIHPIAILDTGFILSYGASAGIILLYPPLTRLCCMEDLISKRTDVGIVSYFVRRFPLQIVQAILVSLAAQLAILPATVHFFGSQPLWSLLVNLIAIPLAMFAYGFAMIGIITGIVPVALVSDFLYGCLTSTVRFFSKLPLASIGIARFPAWLVILCAIICILASDLSKIPEKIRRFIPFFIILAVFISNGCAHLSTRGVSIVFLSAGEADSAVIRSEGKVYLIDTGDSYSPAADYLSAMNYKPDGIFITHPHSDHAGGLADILDICTPEHIYISENWDSLEKDEGIAETLELAAKQGSEIISISAGDSIALSDKTLLEVLSPAAGFPADLANDDSLVLRLEYGGCSAVFTGDVPAGIIEGKIGDADILKVAHHGSKDSLSADLLTEISPSVAVIPTGYNNYGHPAANILKLLNASGAQVYRTDLHGAITCRLNADGSFAVKCFQSSEDVNGLE